MPTDLRAALRDAAAMLARVKPIDLNVGDDPHGLADRCRALADAPPTVAELLPLVDATHEARWTDADGTEWGAVHADSDGGSRIAIEMRCHRGWMIYYPLASDILLPARLVEVTP